jgi:hypothetical protein
MATDLGLSCDAPVDLVAGPYFAAAVDLRPASADDDAFLADVLRVPAIIMHVSVSPEALREGSAAQQEVAAQPEARRVLGFHRVRRGSPYTRSNEHRKPARGAPPRLQRMCDAALRDYCEIECMIRVTVPSVCPRHFRSSRK